MHKVKVKIVQGVVGDGEYEFVARLCDEPSEHAIDNGLVSKLQICKIRYGNPLHIVDYDRGWNIEPEGEYIDIFREILGLIARRQKTSM